MLFFNFKNNKMKYLIKFLFGFVYLFFKYLTLVLFSITSILWNFSTKEIKEFYNEEFNTFYVNNRVGSLEIWSYITFMDFIKNNKTYKYHK